MGISDARGLLVKLDDGLFDLLDHETEIRRIARPNEGAIPRTDVVRELLRFALIHFATERGESVPEIALAPVSVQPKRRKPRAPRPRAKATTTSEGDRVERKPEVSAPQVQTLGDQPSAPPVVQVGRASGTPAFGVRKP